jgi:gamma-glutamyltranspeptidase/glutathione hydrolase
MNVVLWRRDTGAVEAGADPRWKGVGKGASSDADKGSIYR